MSCPCSTVPDDTGCTNSTSRSGWRSPRAVVSSFKTHCVPHTHHHLSPIRLSRLLLSLQCLETLRFSYKQHNTQQKQNILLPVILPHDLPCSFAGGHCEAQDAHLARSYHLGLVDGMLATPACLVFELQCILAS